MAEKLIRQFRYIEEKMGVKGRTLLAQETKITSIRAALLPDDQTTLKKLDDAIRKLTGTIPPRV